MSYMFVYGPCVSCNAMMGYNPNKVPSLRIDGVRKAICERCFNTWNTIHRTNKGLDPLPLDPEAYSPVEVCDT